MKLIEGIEQGSKLKLHADPFKKECLSRVFIHFSYGKWSATVEFINGKTKGAYSFGPYPPEGLSDLLTEMKVFVDSL